MKFRVIRMCTENGVIVPPSVVGQFGLLIICSSKWSKRKSIEGRVDGKIKLTLKSPAKTILLAGELGTEPLIFKTKLIRKIN